MGFESNARRGYKMKKTAAIITAVFISGCANEPTYRSEQMYIPAKPSVPYVSTVKRPTPSDPTIVFKIGNSDNSGSPVVLHVTYAGRVSVDCRAGQPPTTCSVSLPAALGIVSGSSDGSAILELSASANGMTDVKLGSVVVRNAEFMRESFRVTIDQAVLYSTPTVTTPTTNSEKWGTELFRFTREHAGYIMVCSSSGRRAWIRATAGERSMKADADSKWGTC